MEDRRRTYRLSAASLAPVGVPLSDEERALLVGCLRALRRNFPYEAPLHQTLTALLGGVDPEAPDAGEPDPLSGVEVGPVTYSPEVSKLVGRLETAAARRKAVRFGYYVMYRDVTQERELEPYLVAYLGGNWYVVGRDRARDGVRMFRVDRIRGRVGFVSKRSRGDFEIPQSFDPQEYRWRAPWQLGEVVGEARLALSPVAAAIISRAYPRAGRFEDGQFLTPYAGERQLSAWVLALDGQARVISPPSLQERVEGGLRRVLEAHGG